MKTLITPVFTSDEVKKISEYAKKHACSLEDAIKKAVQIFLAKAGCTPAVAV